MGARDASELLGPVAPYWQDSRGVYEIYPDRSHWTCMEPGWEQVADDALEWAVRNARPSNVRTLKAA